MKPNQTDLAVFKSEINKIKLSENSSDFNSTIIIPDIFAAFFDEMEKKSLVLDEREKRIENIIKNNNDNKSLSCSKIAQLYSEKYDKSVSRVTVYRILTKKLDYRFRKTAVKTNKLLGIESIKQTFFILKIIARIIKLSGELVFIDESAFYNENNNLKMWRKNDEEINFDITDTKKVNLILAVTQSKVVYYKITSTSTNEDTFKKFMEDLYDSLSFNERENYCF